MAVDQKILDEINKDLREAHALDGSEAGLQSLSKSTGIPVEDLRLKKASDETSPDNKYDSFIANMPDGGHQERDSGIGQEAAIIAAVVVVVLVTAIAYRFRPKSMQARASVALGAAWVAVVLVFNFSMDTDMWRDADDDMRLFVLCASVPVLLLVSRPAMTWISKGKK